METDCSKPSVAPKPRVVCHANLKPPHSPASAARRPGPSVAPKPKITVLQNGKQQGISNGAVFTPYWEDENKQEDRQNMVLIEMSPTNKLPKANIFKSPTLSPGMSKVDRSVTRQETKEGDLIQKIDEDWRLSDSALTDETDSLETIWLNEAGVTADPMEKEDMIDAEVTNDTDAGAYDAGEALADTDGLSVGEFSVNSTDEEARSCSSDSQDVKRTGLCLQGDDDRSHEPNVSVRENIKNLGGPRLLQTKRREGGGDVCHDHDLTPTVSKLKCGQTGKRKVGNSHDVCFYNFGSEKRQADHEPFYVSSEDIIKTELRMEKTPTEACFSAANKRVMMNGKCEETGEDTQIEDCLSFSPNYEERSDQMKPFDISGDLGDAVDDILNHFGCLSRSKVESASIPSETDTSPTSSLSEIQVLSPDGCDVLREDDAHIVPYRDLASDFADEHLYEEPGQDSPTRNVFQINTKVTRVPSHRVVNQAEDNGAQFYQRTYKSGLRPLPLSSSPVMSSTRNKSLTKPNYLSLYSRSFSVEGHDTPSSSRRAGSPRQTDALCLSESFSGCSPQSSSALSTPTSLVDIPPPFELAYITKKPITKSSPSLLSVAEPGEKSKKKKSSIKRFLMLKFGWKGENKKGDDNKTSPKSPGESSHHSGSRLLELDRHGLTRSPQLLSRSAVVSPELASTFLVYKESRRKDNSVAFLNRSVIRVESFEDRSRVPFVPLPLTKPRSISFPNADTSDYENVPPISSDYENVQVPHWRPAATPSRSDFFDRPFRILSSAHETDGYVDMSSLPGFEKKMQSSEQHSESVCTEEYVCPAVICPKSDLRNDSRRDPVSDEDQGRTSEEEDGGMENNYDRQPDGQSRAFYVVMELVDTERAHVNVLKLLQEDFREAVSSAVGDEGQPVLDDERLREILNELPDVYALHRKILNELENRIRLWEDNQRIADIFLSRKAEFLVFTTYIGHYDRSMSLLDESYQISPGFAAIVQKFEEQSTAEKTVSIKHQLLQVIVRVAQYRMFLTDYLNNLSPDSREYEDTQAAVGVVSDIADQINDNIKHGENLLRLINIAYSVHGQRDLLHPGRVFVKEGTLMKVSRKSRQPRHLFLMNDVLLYTYPQQDGKYRLKNTLPLAGLKVSKPVIENALNVLKIEGMDISIILSASSFLEREDWFYTLNRTVSEQTKGSSSNSCSGELRHCLKVLVGEKAPTLVPVSQVMMCMSCTADFSLTLRRHHCHGCGRIVCRSCLKNKYPLKYLKDRMAKVCDQCYNDLKKRAGGDTSDLSGSSSPRVTRSSRPLSTVFQNIHPPNIWRHRKGIITFTHMTMSEEGSISGTLQRSKKSRKHWKRLWFLLKDKVLYTYRAQEEKVASESLPLLGFTVKLPDMYGGDDEANVFQLFHKSTLFYSFKAEDNFTAQRWVNAMEEATNL